MQRVTLSAWPECSDSRSPQKPVCGTGKPLSPSSLPRLCAQAVEVVCEVRNGDRDTEASFRRKWSFQSGPKIVFSKKEKKKDHDIKLNVT